MITTSIQNELIDHIKAIDGFADYNVCKYDGQLSVEDISQIALTMPAILVFYNGSEYSSEVEAESKYKRNSIVQLLVCSDNLANKDSKSDEALDIKDSLIAGLTGMQIEFTLGETTDAVNYIYQISVAGDSILIRDPILTVVAVNLVLSGMDN
jgi:phage gp37-like protein